MPARKPTNLKRLAGTLRPDRFNPLEPQIEPIDDVSSPPGLTKTERSHWEKIAPLLIETRVLTEADRTALARYCQLSALFPALKRAAKNDATALNSLLKLSGELRSLEIQFGLTPSSRGKVSVAPQRQPPSKLARFLPDTAKERRFFGEGESEEKKAARRRLLFGGDAA